MELAPWKDIIALTASVSTVMQFLSGIMMCQKYVEKGTTGDTSCFPFITGFLSCSLWLRYGFLTQEESIILVNTIGATLFLAYSVTYLCYTLKKSNTMRQLMIVLVALTGVLVYTTLEERHDVAVFRMGLLCSGVTVLFFAAPLATFIYVVKTKCTDSLPFPLILASFVVSLQWWVYGVILDDIFVQVPNFLGFALSGFQLTLFLLYPSNPKGYNLVKL